MGFVSLAFSSLGLPLFGLQLCWASSLVGFSIAGLQLFGLQFHSSAALWASALFGFSFFGFGLLGFISLGFGSVGLRLFGPYPCWALALWLQVCQASAHLGFSPVGFRRLMPKRRKKLKSQRRESMRARSACKVTILRTKRSLGGGRTWGSSGFSSVGLCLYVLQLSWSSVLWSSALLGFSSRGLQYCWASALWA